MNLRRLFQFHLSTAMLWTAIASVLLFLNLPRTVYVADVDLNYSHQGWPLCWGGSIQDLEQKRNTLWVSTSESLLYVSNRISGNSCVLTSFSARALFHDVFVAIALLVAVPIIPRLYSRIKWDQAPRVIMLGGISLPQEHALEAPGAERDVRESAEMRHNP